MTLVTAVIMSYNRQDMLRRELVYYANKPVHLIFADGSDTDWGSGASGSIGEMTWEYFRSSGWDTYLQRMSEACSRVKTEFMFLLDDEECILWTGVEKAIEFLKQNPDHACAGGSVAITRFKKQKVLLENWGRWCSKFSLTETSSIQRIVHMIDQNRTANLFYQVTRSSVLRGFADQAQEGKLNGKLLGAWEIILTSFVISRGKWVMGAYPYWIRSGGSVAPPTSLPEYVDESSAIEMADLIILLSDIESFEPQSAGPFVGTRKILINSILASYGANSKQYLETINSKLQVVSRGKVRNLLFGLRHWKGYVVKLLADFFPSFYEYKFPREIMRVSTYAKYYADGSKVINEDLSKFESIWSGFPTGLTNLQLEHELSKIKE